MYRPVSGSRSACEMICCPSSIRAEVRRFQRISTRMTITTSAPTARMESQCSRSRSATVTFFGWKAYLVSEVLMSDSGYSLVTLFRME